VIRIADGGFWFDPAELVSSFMLPPRLSLWPTIFSKALDMPWLAYRKTRVIWCSLISTARKRGKISRVVRENPPPLHSYFFLHPLLWPSLFA
jgi:hypothetical protein